MAWPELADISALVKGGIPYPDALEMSPLIADKTLAILAAWAIPEKDRIDGYLDAPPEVISAAHYSH